MSADKDRLDAQVEKHWVDFKEGLSSQKRSYPISEFKAFWNAAKRYAELTKSERRPSDRGRRRGLGRTAPDPLIHRAVAEALNGLADFLEVERKRVPADVLRDAERLECLLFSGYDPYFEGDEPPGL
jgi:hypothetical protein